MIMLLCLHNVNYLDRRRTAPRSGQWGAVKIRIEFVASFWRFIFHLFNPLE